MHRIYKMCGSPASSVPTTDLQDQVHEMAKFLTIILALAITVAVLEARVYEPYTKNGDLNRYVDDQRVSSYNDYAERREREFGSGQQSGRFGQQSGSFGQQSGSFGQQSGSFGQQSGSFGQQSGSFGQHTGFGRQPVYGESTVVIRNPPIVPHQNTGFGQQRGIARQYPGVYTPERHVTHLSVRDRPSYGYEYNAYGR